MKIAFISLLAGWGGSEELWVAAANAALDHGNAVGVWVGVELAAAPKVERLRQRGARLFTRRSFPPGRLAKYIATVSRPFSSLAPFRPDVVCINQPNTYAVIEQPEFAGADRFLWATGIPFCVICHWNSDRSSLHDRGRTAVSSLFSRAARVAFVAGANRASTVRQLVDSLPNSIHVNNPLNISDTSAVAWPLDPTIKFACVARLSTEYKGQDLLLEAFSAPLWRNRSWNLSLCGEGPDRPHLEKLVQFYDLGSRVQLRGHVADVRSIWSEHQMLVLPSHSEGTPLALIEAMICGRPAVVTDVGGNAERIEEGLSGFVAEAPTVRSISNALERAWGARHDWPGLGAHARRAALARLDPNPGETLLSILTGLDRSAASGNGISASC